MESFTKYHTTTTTTILLIFSILLWLWISRFEENACKIFVYLSQMICYLSCYMNYYNVVSIYFTTIRIGLLSQDEIRIALYNIFHALRYVPRFTIYFMLYDIFYALRYIPRFTICSTLYDIFYAIRYILRFTIYIHSLTYTKLPLRNLVVC